MLVFKVKDFFKFLSALLISKLLKLFGGDSDIWIVTERPFEAKDNGFHFFKYMREHHADRKVYYAIEKNAKHLNRIAPLGNIIYFNSFKHYLYACSATKLIGAFNPVGIPDSISFYKFANLITGKKVFLQHGLTKEQVKSLTYAQTNFDLFCCGAEPEYNFVRGSFGYPKGIVKYLGLCRYDNLDSHTKKKQILLMPTWRQFLPSQTFQNPVKDIAEIEQEFLQSDYYKHYNSLLSNDVIITFLEGHGYTLIFYLHHELQRFTPLFKGHHKNIIMADDSNYDVQVLLKESEILLTDYSSVAFDFAYMEKPLIYYQFDEMQYYNSHYARGFFNYDTMGFGVVVHNQTHLVEILLQHFDKNENHFYNNAKYIRRVREFFTYRDTDNCERTYHAINDIK